MRPSCDFNWPFVSFVPFVPFVPSTMPLLPPPHATDTGSPLDGGQSGKSKSCKNSNFHSLIFLFDSIPTGFPLTHSSFLTFPCATTFLCIVTIDTLIDSDKTDFIAPTKICLSIYIASGTSITLHT